MYAVTETKKPPIMRFVCVPCKSELVFKPSVLHAEANAEIARHGWRIAFIPEPYNYWGLCCEKCVELVT